MKKDYFFIIIAGILSGSIVFGGKVLSNLGLSLYEISVLPFAFSIIVLSLFVIFKKQYRPKKKMLWLLFFYGVVGLFITIAQFGAVVLGTSVALTVLLLYTQPLWTILFTFLFLKEKITTKEIVTCVIVLLGLFVLVNPFQGILSNNWVGILLAMIGGISLSGWVVISSTLSKKGNNPINSLFMGNFFMIILLLVLYPLATMLIHDNSLVRLSLYFKPVIWLYILLFGFIVGIVAPLLILYGVKKVPTVDAGIILLLEPVTGAILATIFLKQILTLNIIIGGVLILLANYLVIKK